MSLPHQLPPPFPLAMIVCDAIHRDPGTGKVTILGCFSFISSKIFPAAHPLMCLYVAVTDGYGEVKIDVRLVDADEEHEAIWCDTKEIAFRDPRDVCEMSFPMSGVIFPRAGEYRFQLLANDEFLMERRIIVHPIE